MPQKYEREIEEILSRLDQSPPSGRVLTPLPPLERRPPRRPRVNLWPRVLLSASTLMLVACCLEIFTYPLQWIYLPAVGVVGVVAAAMLIASVVLSLLKWNRGGPTKTWRGQPMDLGGGGFSPS